MFRLTGKFKQIILIIVILMLTTSLNACNRGQYTPLPTGTGPNEAPLNIKQDLNAVNLKNTLSGGSLYEDDIYIYYVNRDGDIYKYNTGTNEKSMIIDLNSQYTGYLNVQNDLIYFILAEKKDNPEEQITSVYVVNKDGSGLKKLFDGASNLRLINSDAYYLESKTGLLYKYSLLSGESEKIFDVSMNGYDIVGDKIYCIESMDPNNKYIVDIVEYGLYSKEKKTLLTSLGADPSDLKNTIIGSLQYYNGFLYYVENKKIQKYDFNTAKVETIAVDPSEFTTVNISGLLVSSKGIYFFSWGINEGSKGWTSHLYYVDGKTIDFYTYENALILSVYLTKDYIVIDAADATAKATIKKILNYKGQEVQLDW